jgi:hypothetical protein
MAAIAAARDGGPEVALRPVKQAAANLESLVGGVRGPGEIAQAVLLAAAAAAQTERGEMTIYLVHALQMEELQAAAGQPGAPGLSAHEAAGDLWLEVHQYQEARAAYVRANELVGATPRVTIGLARVARRLQERDDACAGYRALLAAWGSRTASPEIAEAEAFLRETACPAASR